MTLCTVELTYGLCAHNALVLSDQRYRTMELHVTKGDFSTSAGIPLEAYRAWVTSSGTDRNRLSLEPRICNNVLWTGPFFFGLLRGSFGLHCGRFAWSLALAGGRLYDAGFHSQAAEGRAYCVGG